MKSLARLAATVAMTLFLGFFTAQSASADVNFITENGPGHLGFSNVRDAHHVDVEQLNESIKTGDFNSYLKGILKNSHVTFPEVEGAEQDQGEGA